MVRLYHFFSQQYGLEAIRDNRLKISRITELNDPFEFMGFNFDELNHQVFSTFKEWASTEWGLVCMSQSWQHPMLWGHYANNHKGLCLGFDVTRRDGDSDDPFYEVMYLKEKPKLPKIDKSSSSPFSMPLLKKLIYSKFEDWSYEQEYRALIPLDDGYKDPVSELHFRGLAENVKLAEVIVGERSTLNPAKLKEVLGHKLLNTAIFKVKASPNEFKLIKDVSANEWQQLANF